MTLLSATDPDELVNHTLLHVLFCKTCNNFNYYIKFVVIWSLKIQLAKVFTLLIFISLICLLKVAWLQLLFEYINAELYVGLSSYCHPPLSCVFWCFPWFNLTELVVSETDLQRELWGPHFEKQELCVAAIFGDNWDAWWPSRLGTIKINQVTGLGNLQKKYRYGIHWKS